MSFTIWYLWVEIFMCATSKVESSYELTVLKYIHVETLAPSIAVFCGSGAFKKVNEVIRVMPWSERIGAHIRGGSREHRLPLSVHRKRKGHMKTYQKGDHQQKPKLPTPQSWLYSFQTCKKLSVCWARAPLWYFLIERWWVFNIILIIIELNHFPPSSIQSSLGTLPWNPSMPLPTLKLIASFLWLLVFPSHNYLCF